MYSIPIYIGSPESEFLATIAILHSGIWVQGVDCPNCKLVSSQYDPHNSTGSFYQNKSSSYEDLNKKLILEGSVYSDTVNISGLVITTDISVASQFVDPFNLAEDGILGLGKDQNSIVFKWYELGYLSSPVYSLYNPVDDYPYLLLDELNFTDLDLDLNETLKISLKESLSGELSFNDKTYEAYPVEFSSINSYFSGPYVIMQELYSDLIENFNCYYVEEYLACECDSEFKDIYITIQGVTLTIPSSLYLMTVQNACFLYAETGSDRWILGEPLLKNYLVSVDLLEESINFYVVSPKEHYEPSAFETYEGWAVVIGAVLGSLAIYLAAAGIYQIIKKRMEREDEEGAPLLEVQSNKGKSRQI